MRISDWSSDVCSSDLLTLQTIGVDRVDDRDRRGLADLLDETHAVVEVALDLDHDRAVHDRLREFAEGDLAIRNQYECGDAGPYRVGRGGGRCVAGQIGRAHV